MLQLIVISPGSAAYIHSFPDLEEVNEETVGIVCKFYVDSDEEMYELLIDEIEIDEINQFAFLDSDNLTVRIQQTDE
jgi:hypothetical protein